MYLLLSVYINFMEYMYMLFRFGSYKQIRPWWDGKIVLVYVTDRVYLRFVVDISGNRYPVYNKTITIPTNDIMLVHSN